MKYLVLFGILFAGCDMDRKCYQWASPPLKEDLLACNAVRAGASDDYTQQRKFDACMKSLGYYRVEVPCND